MVHKCYDHRRGKCDSRKCEHHTEKLLLDYFGWTTILWGNSGDHLSQKSFLADSCQASLPWAFTFFQHYHRRLKTSLDSTNSGTGNRYFDNPVIKSTLWWAPFSIILTLGAETSSHHRHTHTHTQRWCFRLTVSLCCPHGDPAQVLCTSSLCLRSFHWAAWMLHWSEGSLGGSLPADSSMDTSCPCTPRTSIYYPAVI